MRRVWGALAIALTLGAAPAMADDAACIAASEASLPLREKGRLHEALKQLVVCADASCPAEVKAECARRIDAVNAAMPTLILAAKDGSGNDLIDVRVSMDGAPLVSSLDGRPQSIDPGEHVFVFEQAGQAPVEKRLVLREGDRDRREEVVIGPPPPPRALPPVGPPPSPGWWNTQRTLAVIGGGLGVVGIGLGAGWGAFAMSAQSQEKQNCSTSSCGNPKQATEDYNTAKTDATASTVAFAAGGAFLAAGAVLWFTAPSVQVTPVVGSRSGGIVVGGGF